MKRFLFLAAAACFFITGASAQSARLSRTHKKLQPKDTSLNRRDAANGKTSTRVMTDADRNNPASPNNPVKPAAANAPAATAPPKGNTTNPAR